MKLELRAYKAQSPIYSKEKFLIYGANRKDAINKFCSSISLSTENGYLGIKNSLVVRVSEGDFLYSLEESRVLRSLETECLEMLMDALGVEIGALYTGSFKKNYVVFDKEEDVCETLLREGLMTKKYKPKSVYYFVSKKGIKAAITLMLIPKRELKNVNKL